MSRDLREDRVIEATSRGWNQLRMFVKCILFLKSWASILVSYQDAVLEVRRQVEKIAKKGDLIRELERLTVPTLRFKIVFQAHRMLHS